MAETILCETETFGSEVCPVSITVPAFEDLLLPKLSRKFPREATSVADESTCDMGARVWVRVVLEDDLWWTGGVCGIG